MKNKKYFFSIRSVTWYQRRGRLSHDFWVLNSWDWPYWWLGEMFSKATAKRKEMIVCGWFTSRRMKQRGRWWRNIRAGETGWTSVFTGMVMREKETRAVMVSEEHCLWQSILNASTVQSICKEAAKVAAAKGSGKKWKWLQHIQWAFVNQQTAGVLPSTATCKRAEEAGSSKQRLSG